MGDRTAQAKANLVVKESLWHKDFRGIRLCRTHVFSQRRNHRQSIARTIEELRPQNLFVQLGGGVQERLGLYLKNSKHVPAILLGAAWHFYRDNKFPFPIGLTVLLGWMFRCFDQPRVFFPRYMKSFRLVYLLFKYGERLPVK